MNSFIHTRSRQSGAALVVGLILLVVLTLMAIASMNSASLDLVMSGNEQYRSRAFVAAETGIEQALLNTAAFDSSTDYPNTTVSTGTGNDSFTYNVTRPNTGVVMPPPPGNSSGTFGAVYFAITSTGTSERNSKSVNTQELFQVVKSGGDQTYNSSVCAGTTSLDSTCP